MATNNLPVTSREYKLILNSDRFQDLAQGVQLFRNLIEFLINKSGGTIIEKQDEITKRHTSYLDTPELALNNQGFSLRLREEEAERNLNLKYRSSDRYISAAQDVSASASGKSKFEEDILPPFASKFSKSTSIKSASPFSVGTFGKLIELFPGLSSLEISKDSRITTVNDFTALEVVIKLYKFKFGQGNVVKASLSFWYLSGAEEGWPMIGEFSFDYDVADPSMEATLLEQFSAETVKGANRLFKSLQNQPAWFDLSGTTKTAFALDKL